MILIQETEGALCGSSAVSTGAGIAVVAQRDSQGYSTLHQPGSAFKLSGVGTLVGNARLGVAKVTKPKGCRART